MTEKLIDQWHNRFWSKVNITKDCWLWTAGIDKDGYGKFAVGGKGTQRHFRSHRLSWYLSTGHMPNNSELVLHKCDVPNCINPDHLFLGDQKDNIRDAIAKGRHSVLPGTDHPRSKLTEDQVIAIRSSQDSDKVLATNYKVSKSTIQNIRSNRQWRHLL